MSEELGKDEAYMFEGKPMEKRKYRVRLYLDFFVHAPSEAIATQIAGDRLREMFEQKGSLIFRSEVLPSEIKISELPKKKGLRELFRRKKNVVESASET